jgi:MOSC domain-containing protein YiiM
MTAVPRLQSVQVGMPVLAVDLQDRPWRTGFFKRPVSGPVWLGSSNLAGDGQANLKVHGGADKAVLAYSAEHYVLWREELAKPDLPYGAFAENFTISGLDEDTVCLGDVYAIGEEVRVQVSQPRQPCVNISRRWRLPDLTKRVEVTGRTGWYLRVIAEGLVEAGIEVRLLERPSPEWSVSRATIAMRRRSDDRVEAAALAAVPALSSAWRGALPAPTAGGLH